MLGFISACNQRRWPESPWVDLSYPSFNQRYEGNPAIQGQGGVCFPVNKIDPNFPPDFLARYFGGCFYSPPAGISTLLLICRPQVPFFDSCVPFPDKEDPSRFRCPRYTMVPREQAVRVTAFLPVSKGEVLDAGYRVVVPECFEDLVPLTGRVISLLMSSEPLVTLPKDLQEKFGWGRNGIVMNPAHVVILKEELLREAFKYFSQVLADETENYRHRPHFSLALKRAVDILSLQIGIVGNYHFPRELYIGCAYC